MAPGPTTKHSPPEQVKWEPKLACRVHQQQWQGNSKCGGDAKDSKLSEVWRKNVLGVDKILTRNLGVKEYFVKQRCHGEIWKKGYVQKQNEKIRLNFFEVEGGILSL